MRAERELDLSDAKEGKRKSLYVRWYVKGSMRHFPGLTNENAKNTIIAVASYQRTFRAQHIDEIAACPYSLAVLYL